MAAPSYTKDGILLKKAGKDKGVRAKKWSKRYFILTGGSLYFYHDIMVRILI
jgi:hypothetical protein